MVQINDVLAKSIGNMNRSMNQSNPSNPSNPTVPSNPSYRVFKAEDQVGKEGKAKKVNINVNDSPPQTLVSTFSKPKPP